MDILELILSWVGSVCIIGGLLYWRYESVRDAREELASILAQEVVSRTEQYFYSRGFYDFDARLRNINEKVDKLDDMTLTMQAFADRFERENEKQKGEKK